MLGRWLWLVTACVTATAGTTAADSSTSPIEYRRACDGPGVRCGARIAMRDGKPLVIDPTAPPFGGAAGGAQVPTGDLARPPIDIGNLAPVDIQAAYHIDPTAGSGVTVAIIDAYSYKNLESDLAMYRSHFNLPDCTKANGCLRILNDQGEASPLPAGSDAGWEAETALDMDMVSAACPACNLVVIQTDAGKLDSGERAAAALAVDTISASWGSIENGGEPAREPSFHHPGIATFAASGDNAYDSGGMGPEYPATSAYVVAVGGTKLSKSLGGLYYETAWDLAGSSCSSSIATPAFQPASATAACPMRASSDVSAEADPSTGVAVYESSAGGWIDVGGTSAATPIVAALMAAVGHGDIAPDFIYHHPEAFQDITTGNNGSCATALCDAGSGWDGPTGLGSPNQGALALIGGGAGPALAVSSPADGATEDPGFSISVTAGAATTHVDLAVDGKRVLAVGPPFDLTLPASVTAGMHQLTLSAYDEDHDVTTATLAVNVTDGGCSTSGRPGGIILGFLAVALVTTRRRRRVFPLTM